MGVRGHLEELIGFCSGIGIGEEVCHSQEGPGSFREGIRRAVDLVAVGIGNRVPGKGDLTGDVVGLS